MIKRYLVDTRGYGDIDDIRECSTLAEAKDPLYNAWQGDEENGWTFEEIDDMDESLTADALEGIGYTLVYDYETALDMLS